MNSDMRNRFDGKAAVLEVDLRHKRPYKLAFPSGGAARFASSDAMEAAGWIYAFAYRP